LILNNKVQLALPISIDSIPAYLGNKKEPVAWQS